eukprot:m.368994 g.368994  ORF g.368994 m.368994 type:complete len:61 (+) comp20845_c0_seq17:2123-2305(+)
MAIADRANVLCQNVGPREANAIKLQVHKLTEDMGMRFKFAVVIGNRSGAPMGGSVPVFER